MTLDSSASPVVHVASSTAGPAGRRLGTAFYELVLIVVGVLIALAVDEWREQRALAQNARAALTQVRLELERNQALVLAAAPRHDATAQAYQAALARLRADQTFARPEGELGNVVLAPLTRSAFEALIVSGVATTLSPATLATVAQAYDSDLQYRDLNGRYLSSVLATDFMDGERYFQQMWFWAETLAGEERALAEQHVRAMAAVDIELGTAD